ncbi:ribonuclease P protein component [Candidatus Saccharibacteria bacterium]|nr:ribonuclease P protein component [Candidatus Saccharibacteria bacterium]
MIPFRNRFHGHNSLRYVYKNGQIVRSHFATLKSIPNPNRKNPRFAVVVSKKVLKSAVRRNRIRRRIYDYIRNQTPRLDQNYDIVLIVSSSELLNIPSSELLTQLEHLFTQSKLYKTTKN